MSNYHHDGSSPAQLEQDAQLQREEFGDINTAPNDPRHVEQVLNHIAHLDDPQVDAIRTALNEWHGAEQGVLRARNGRLTQLLRVVRVRWSNRSSS